MQSETFNKVPIGNKFKYQEEWFVKMNLDIGIGYSGRTVVFNASTHVLMPIYKDRDMCD